MLCNHRRLNMPSLLTDSIFKPSLENMQQQKPDFFNELTVIIEKLKRKEYNDREAEAKLNECIKKYTNLTVASKIDRSMGFINAFVETAEFDQAHIFWEQWAQEYDEFTGRMKKPLNGSTGYIDSVNGKVGGIFAEYVNKMTLTGALINELSPEQTAAVILHEIGHTYTFCYYLGHVAISNLVITQAVRSALKQKDLDKRTKIIKQAADYLNLNEYDFIDEGDVGVGPEYSHELKAETLMLNVYRIRHKSATGTDIYDIRSCEQLADQFAVRHGAGYALATATDKFEGRNGAGPRSRVGVWFSRLTTTLSIILMGMISFGIIPLLILLGVVGMSHEKMYDDPSYRIRLIKQNMIDRLKTLTMDKDERASLLRQIDKIQQVERNNKDDSPIVRSIAYALSKARTKEMNTEKMQKYLEDMVFSRLYVTHGKLDQLGV